MVASKAAAAGAKTALEAGLSKLCDFILFATF
jgi:hypothetical protein